MNGSATIGWPRAGCSCVRLGNSVSELNQQTRVGTLWLHRSIDDMKARVDHERLVRKLGRLSPASLARSLAVLQEMFAQ